MAMEGEVGRERPEEEREKRQHRQKPLKNYS